MSKVLDKAKRRVRRKMRVRKKITGTADRFRLTVYRSVNHIYAQIIDDVNQQTLISSSTNDKGLRENVAKMPKVEQSRLVGAELARRALASNITRVAFDRNGYLYHGRVKALAEAARENGLVF